MTRQITWTKTILEDFISEALLTEDEEKVLRTRIEGWSIVKQSLDLGIGSTATISRIIKRINNKYEQLSNLYPDRFPERKQTKFESLLDGEVNKSSKLCPELLGQVVTTCTKDFYNMSPEDLVECQNNCPYMKLI